MNGWQDAPTCPERERAGLRMVPLCSWACGTWARGLPGLKRRDRGREPGHTAWMCSGSCSKWVWLLKDQRKFCGRRGGGWAWSLPGTRGDPDADTLLQEPVWI